MENPQGIWIFIKGDDLCITVSNGANTVSVVKSRKEFVEMVRPIVMETPPC